VSLKKFCFTIAATLIAAAAHAQTKPEASLTANPVFQENCAKCHGKAADGRMFAGPSLVDEKTTGMSADDLRNIITNGRKRMPKFADKLKPEEINAIVDQIKAVKK